MVGGVRERGGSFARCSVLPKGGRDEEERGCSELSRDVRIRQGCEEVYGRSEVLLTAREWHGQGGERGCSGLQEFVSYWRM